MSTQYPVPEASKFNLYRNDSPANLIRDRGVFWGMMRNTGEYDELVQLVPEHR